jgi:hypothetical protein
VGEPAKKERVESEGVKQKSAVLIAQFSWCAHAWNVSPEKAAQQVITDLYGHLSRGGMVSVRIEDSDGKEYLLEVRAR